MKPQKTCQVSRAFLSEAVMIPGGWGTQTDLSAEKVKTLQMTWGEQALWCELVKNGVTHKFGIPAAKVKDFFVWDEPGVE